MANDTMRLFPMSKDDDLSSYAHRQLIGFVGLILPLFVWLIAGWRPIPDLTRWGLLNSISAYYYTGASSFFCGALVALGFFLYTYRGYRNKYNFWNRIFSIIAGTAVILVAFFPTSVPEGIASIPWWTDIMGKIHYISAVVFFLCLVVFSVYLFTRPSPKQAEVQNSKRKTDPRNYIYIFCGVAITICLAWAGIASINHLPIFWPEAFSLWFFAISWLVKGRAEKTLANGLSMFRHPIKTARYFKRIALSNSR